MSNLPPSPDRQRLDKWLFFARIAKSRTLAGKLAAGGHVRVNGDKKLQPSYMIKPGDVLTIVLDRKVLVLEVLDCGVRRGPAPEARMLYDDRSPQAAPHRSDAPAQAEIREPGTGRPTKKERRQIEKLKFPGRQEN